jgi:hypothetical protein
LFSTGSDIKSFPDWFLCIHLPVSYQINDNNFSLA